MPKKIKIIMHNAIMNGFKAVANESCPCVNWQLQKMKSSSNNSQVSSNTSKTYNQWPGDSLSIILGINHVLQHFHSPKLDLMLPSLQKINQMNVCKQLPQKCYFAFEESHEVEVSAKREHVQGLKINSSWRKNDRNT